MGNLLSPGLRDPSSCHLSMPLSQHVAFKVAEAEKVRWGIMLAYNNLYPEVMYHAFVQWPELVLWLHPNYKGDQQK